MHAKGMVAETLARMTVSSSTRRAGPFNGNDATTAFPFTFKVFAAADVGVYLTDAAGVQTKLTSNYSITLNGDQDATPGGTINYPTVGSPLPTGSKLDAIGDVQYTQGTDLTNLGRFQPEVIERALDKLTTLAQQLKERFARAISFPVGDTADATLPRASDRAGKALVFDADGNVDVSADIATQAAAAAAARLAIDSRIYPGTYAADPVTRPDGSGIQNGDRYFRSTDNNERIYRSGVWVNFEAAAAASATAAGASAVAAGASQVAAAASDADANAAKVAAVIAKSAAETARDIVVNSTSTFADTASGLAGTTSGKVFFVKTANPQAFDVYQNSAGAATALGTLNIAYGALIQAASGESPYGFNLADDDGYVYAGLTPGVVDVQQFVITQGTQLGIATGLAIIDDDGYWAEIVTPAGATAAASLTTADSTLYAARNASNLAAGRTVASTVNSEVPPVYAAYTVLLHYGQSLALGIEGWPALTRTQPYNNVMIGGAPYSSNAGADTFAPCGGSSAFQPLVELTYGSSDAAVAAFAPGTQALGETMCAGWANGLKKLHNNARGYQDDPNIAFVGYTAAVGGKTIAQLSKGAAPNLFQAMVQGATAAKANAVAAGKPIALGAWVWAQGENDYGAATTKAAYKAAWITLDTNISSDIITAVFGQSRPVPRFVFDVSRNTRTLGNSLDTANSIDQALLELSNERTNVYHVGGTYQATDKGTHMSGNGYRWRASILAKVAYRVLYERKEWKPLQPRATTLSANKLSIDFLVPQPPLAFDLPYIITTATDFADKGFAVTDSIGAVAIQSARIVYDTVVELTLVRAPVGTAYLRYADANHSGAGCLRDSDSFVSPDSYTYTAGTGQTADENIAALVGKPYPNQNWCVPFNLQIQ